MSKTYNHKTSKYTVEYAFYSLYTHGNGERVSEYGKELYDEYWTPFKDVPIEKLTTKELKEYREKLLLSCELKKVNDIFCILEDSCGDLTYYNTISELCVPSILDYYNEYDYYKSKTFNIKSKTRFEIFIDNFIDTKIDVSLVKFNKISKDINYRFKRLREKEYKTSESVYCSGYIIKSMMENYSSYICFNTVSNMMKYDFFLDISEVKKEIFLKKTAWFMSTMYEVEGDACGWQYYDDAGIVGNMMHSFKESIEKQYSQKMDEWEIVK